MTDCFALLNEPRRPWLDSEQLKTKFHAVSAACHPDHFPASSEAQRRELNQRFAEINAAFRCLNDLKDRLQHLLELEAGAKPKDVQRLPPGTMDLFMEVGQKCRDTDAFLAERARVHSPMLKVKLLARGFEWTEQLQNLQGTINQKRNALEAELRQLNTSWETAPPPGAAGRGAALPLERIEHLYRSVSYMDRWTEQIQ